MNKRNNADDKQINKIKRASVMTITTAVSNCPVCDQHCLYHMGGGNDATTERQEDSLVYGRSGMTHHKN